MAQGTIQHFMGTQLITVYMFLGFSVKFYDFEFCSFKKG